MLILDDSLKIVNFNPKKPDLKDLKLTLTIDTEFVQKSRSIVLAVMSNDPLNNKVLVFEKHELDDKFDLISRIFNYYGFEFEVLSQDEIDKIETTNGEICEVLFDEKPNSKIDFTNTLLNELMLEYRLDYNNIKVKKQKNGDKEIEIVPDSVQIDFQYFFQVADMFKICGESLQRIYMESNLEQFRVVKFKNRHDIFAKIDGKLVNLSLQIRDRFHTIPPQKNRTLEQNAISLGCKIGKINLKTPEIADMLGVEIEKIMESMDCLLEKNPKLFTEYAAQDVFVTAQVALRQQQLLETVCESLGLEPFEIKDTIGSNVNQIILALMHKHFNASDKDSAKNLKRQIGLSHISNLQNVPQTDFGCQTFLTVGGLLFSRTPTLPHLNGTLSDCDLSSCYSTKMSKMCVYLGEPVVKTFKYQSQKPDLKTVLETLKEMRVPRDGWFVRVSGEFKTVSNSILLSDLRFEPVQSKLKTLQSQIKSTPNRKSIEKFDMTKTSKTMATSRILTKQVKFGIVTADLWDAITTLPQSWINEYASLSVDAIVFHPLELIVDNLNDLEQLKSSLPLEPYRVSLIKNSLQTMLESQYYKQNATLRFDIGQYWSEITKIRSKFKKEKNPVQELFKLIGNSGYGVLACQNLTCNNSVAANIITGNARATSWLMTMSLNGFAPITDGTCFGWKSIPLGKKFKDLVEKNNDYTTNFLETDNMISDDQILQNVENYNEFIKKHQKSFFEVDDDFLPISTYGYELKSENFKTSNGETVETRFFSDYFNSNAGNYCKGFDSDLLLIENGGDYDFEQQYNSVKARSFKSNQELVDWYVNSLKCYKEPFKYSETKIIKFSDGNKLAIKVLSTLKEDEKIIHPMGLATKSFKMLKLISSSQFLFQNEVQLKNFETNENSLFEISKKLLTRSFWENFKHPEKREGVDYYDFSKTHPVGIGLEFLALNSKNNGDIKTLREFIYTIINSGSTNFNASLHLSRNLKLVEKFKYMFGEIVMKKCNAELDLIKIMRDSVGNNTLLTLKKENIKTLENILTVDDID